ncbi:MAG: substrate-binding domain-containing protein [Solirubrobacterales bacterium]|nr:substrate-binding domain-containing protein [Solirubrobacterales bacterium]MBV8946545.1 substrate-binding domain-containing protein [Solirubrobacterales bacterium]
MRRLPRRIGIVACVGAAALLVAACGSSSKSKASGGSTTSAVNIASGSGNKACSYKFALITHGDNGSFWSVVYKGAKDAAADLGCTLTETYGSQQQGQAQPDDNAQNAQIQDAINAKVDGMAVSNHDPSLMNPTLAKAAAAGIPVVLLNAGCDDKDIAASHAITCVGQPEQLAGEAAGTTFSHLGANNVLCVIHQSGQNLLDRCNGIAIALGVGSQCKTGSAPSKGPACTELTLSTPNAASNPQQAIQQVTAYLQTHTGINAVMALNNAIGTALVSSNPPSKPKIATFDLNSGVQSDLTNGSMAFAIDQQQYLQGYLPIVFLDLYKRKNGQTVGGGTTVASGPLVVNKSNVAKVAAAIAAGQD